ncbi:MAG: dTDP-glucose 4,6-dehydratase [Calditrichaeota bacterium]|nr:dTDP-glucose 4,6-dehydratase [Calditrichota bacterium]
MMKTIAITGGAGFIGSNLLIKMVKKYPDFRFINVDKLSYAGNLENLREIESAANYRFQQIDICNFGAVMNLMRSEKITDIIHLAAESHVDRSILGPRAFVETNVLGTFNLLEAARQFWIEQSCIETSRFHHVSTDEVYGSLGATGYFTELTPYQPNSPYSASKAGSDHLVRSYHHTYGMNVVTTNCSNNYGPYQFPEKLIPLVFYNAMNQKQLPVYGDGKNVRDWLYVGDHCDALDLVFHDGKSGETYNVGGHNEKQNIEIVRMICDFVDRNLKPVKSAHDLITFVTDRLGHDRRYAIDASKIETELGWTPSYTFEKGIEETLSWYLKHQEWVEHVISGSYQDYYNQNYANR